MPKWGRITLDRYRELQQQGIHLHVWHDGVDVTNRCIESSDEGDGWAELFAVTTGGRFYVNRHGNAARVIVEGIAIVEGEPLTATSPAPSATAAGLT